MKKVIEVIKSKKKLFIGIMIGGIVVSLVGVVGTIAANSIASNYVLYNSSTGKTNVKDAIDELYTMASTHCPDGKSCVDKPVCTSPRCTDNDSDGYVTIGDLITYSTESFYVISNDGTLIRLLPRYNITPKDSPVQSELLNTNGIAFATSNSGNTYWGSTISTYPAYVYNNNSNLYQYVEHYKTKLQNLGMTVVGTELMSYEEAKYLIETKEYNWVHNQDYWMGTASGKSRNYFVHTAASVTVNGVTCSCNDSGIIDFVSFSAAYGSGCACNGSGNSYAVAIGIRPVITIPVSSL